MLSDGRDIHSFQTAYVSMPITKAVNTSHSQKIQMSVRCTYYKVLHYKIFSVKLFTGT